MLLLALLLAAAAAEGEYAPPALSGEALFLDTMQGDWASRWTHSQKEVYTGKFAAEPYAVDGIAGDVGLAMPAKAHRYGLSRKLEAPAAAAEQPLVVQYEVSLKGGLECGGAYLKLLSVDGAFDGAQLEEPTPYSIMFGPDKCANAGKIHFIFKFRNPVTGQLVEHHLKGGPPMPPSAERVVQTRLYTFALLPGNKLRLSVDGEEKGSYSLLTDFEPPVNPPAQIDDPSDSKPADWVDAKMIPDPAAVKPDDWDEEAPYQIPDPKVRIAAHERAIPRRPRRADAPRPPAGVCRRPSRRGGTTTRRRWSQTRRPCSPPTGTRMTTASGSRRSCPTRSVRRAAAPRRPSRSAAPSALTPQPSAPAAPRSRAGSNPGCGEWKAPTVENPAYKGKWYAPMVDNPAYKGEWAPAQIPNPAFFEDADPAASLLPIGAVGFELWTMDEGVMFDNVLITRSEEVAADFAAKTWGVRHAAEAAAKAEALAADEAPPEKLADKARFYASAAAQTAQRLAAEKPVALGISLFVGFLSLVLLCCWPSAQKRAPAAAPPPPRAAAAAPQPAEPAEAKAGDEDKPSAVKARATRARTPKAAD